LQTCGGLLGKEAGCEEQERGNKRNGEYWPAKTVHRILPG